MKTLPLLDDSRARAAIRAVDSITAKLAAGGEFRSPHAAEFFVRMREMTTRYAQRSLVSVGQLVWLEKLEKGMKGKS